MTSIIKPFKGIIPPMITPLTDTNCLDIKGLERLIEHILSGNVHGLFILGTTGEAPSLSYNLRYEMIKRVTQQVANRVPVLVGITDTSCIESLKIAEYSAEHGVTGVVLAPPYYFPSGQMELLEYLEHLVPELPLPLFLYNMPGCTKINIEPKTVLKASEIDGIAGLKDSSSDMVYFHKVKSLLADKPEFSLLTGPEELLAETVLLGGHGGISGGANIFPSLYVQLYEAAAKGDIERTRQLHEIVIQISSTIYNTGQYNSRVIKGVKCSLSILGICNDYIAEPFHRFRKTEREKIEAYLKNIMVKTDQTLFNKI
jgi:4-hydroxy-tetrahydrodipicolinate synthase